MVIGGDAVRIDSDPARAWIEATYGPVVKAAAAMLEPIARLTDVLFPRLTPAEHVARVGERRNEDAAHVRERMGLHVQRVLADDPLDVPQRQHVAACRLSPPDVVAPLRRHAPPVSRPAGPRAARAVMEAQLAA